MKLFLFLFLLIIGVSSNVFTQDLLFKDTLHAKEYTLDLAKKYAPDFRLAKAKNTKGNYSMVFIPDTVKDASLYDMSINIVVRFGYAGDKFYLDEIRGTHDFIAGVWKEKFNNLADVTDLKKMPFEYRKSILTKENVRLYYFTTYWSIKHSYSY